MSPRGFARVLPVLAVLAVLAVSALAACGGQAGRGEGLDPSTLPVEVRADYDLFAQRCSKCHSLARPLQSGVTDDTFWREYVERMRRQPSSGISPSDEVSILRFLHHYSLAQLQQRGGAGGNK